MVNSKGRGYKELTEKDKRAILGALLAAQVDGELPHGERAKIAKKLGFAPKSVGRLWTSAKITRAKGSVHTPEIISKKQGISKEFRKIYDREQMKEAILAIPLWKRTTVRNLAHELNMPKSTVQDIL